MIDDLLTYAVIDNECYRIGYQEALDLAFKKMEDRLNLYLEREEAEAHDTKPLKEVLSYCKELREELDEYTRSEKYYSVL